MPKTKPKPVTDAAQFDENTPPPRTAPKGVPVPRGMTMPPGAIEDEFKAWVAAGRIAPGSFLTRHVGIWVAESGYVFLDGSPVHPDRLKGVRMVTTVQVSERLETFVVFAPVE